MVGLVAAVLALALQGGGADVRVQRGVEVRPDTVTVGDRFEVVVRLRVPAGSTIEFPPVPDSGGSVAAIDPVRVDPTTESGDAIEQVATYRVAAWNVGDLAIDFAAIIVRSGREVRRVPIPGARVFVRSVLPADSTERVPRPARELITFGPPWWVWALAALAAAVVLLLVWWLWRRRRRRPAPRVDPFVLATREFDRVETLALVAAGERSRHVALMNEVLRDYLASLDPAAATSLTSSELLAALRRGSLFSPARAVAYLNDVDLVKFAGRAVAPERASDLGQEAKALAVLAHARAMAPRLEQAA